MSQSWRTTLRMNPHFFRGERTPLRVRDKIKIYKTVSSKTWRINCCTRINLLVVNAIWHPDRLLLRILPGCTIWDCSGKKGSKEIIWIIKKNLLNRRETSLTNLQSRSIISKKNLNRITWYLDKMLISFNKIANALSPFIKDWVTCNRVEI